MQACLDKLEAKIKQGWSPIDLASDNRGNSLPLKSALATRYSIGGAVQRIFPEAVAPRVMHVIGVVLDALHDSTVLVWETQAGRTVEDVLWLIEIAKMAQRANLIRDLAVKSRDSGVVAAGSYEKALARLFVLMNTRPEGFKVAA